MRVCATLPPRGRDLRLDLFRGLANWAIFLDHIPHEVLSSITTRNYGFSDAALLVSSSTDTVLRSKPSVPPPRPAAQSSKRSSLPRGAIVIARGRNCGA